MGQRRLGRRRWKSLVAGFEQSGLSQAEYARRKGVNVNTFRQWLYRLRDEVDGQGDVPEGGVEFIEVCGVSSQRDAAAVRIRLGAMTLEFDEPPSPQWVVGLLEETSRLDRC